MKNKIITIVGGTGFVGRYVIKLLARDPNCQIRIIARDVDAALHLKTTGNVGQIALVSGDITKPESLAGKLDNSFAVINLAGILYESGRQKFTAVHEKGAGHLATLAKQVGVERFVQLSALGVEQAKESRYASSKLNGEKAVKSAFPEATIFRPSIIFGAEDQFFNKFATLAALSPVMPVIGGKTRFQPAYVADVAQAIVTALQREGTQGKTFELGGPGVYSFRELLEFTCRAIGRDPVFITIPFGMAQIKGSVMQLLPRPPLTRDQVLLLKYNNVVSAGAHIFRDLGIFPQSLENIVPLYLARFVQNPSQAAA